MNETEFNASLRGVMRAQGLRVTHVKEADQPGVLDLIVRAPGLPPVWMELKIGDEAVRPSQVDFIWEEMESDAGLPCLLVRLVNLPHPRIGIYVPRPGHKGEFMLKSQVPSFMVLNWTAFLIKHL